MLLFVAKMLSVILGDNFILNDIISDCKRIKRGAHILKRSILIIAIIMTLPASFVQAQDKDYYVENSAPVQISIFEPYAIPPGLNTVRGARLNLIYGNTMNVYGLDCGLIQRASGNVDAIQIGVVNITGNTRPIQFAVLLNNSAEMTGLQIGLINLTRELSGVQIGLINISRSRIMPLINWPD